MNKFRLLAVCILSFSIFSTALAQQAPNDTITSVGKSLYFNAGLQYLSNLTYAGRRDESSVPVLMPTFTLITKGGFFVSGIGYFDVNGAKSGAEGLSITPGYVFSFDQKKQFGGNISATKYFLTNNSPIILSSFNASVDGQLSYTGVVKFTLGGSYRIGKDNKNDIIDNAEISKEITLLSIGKNKQNSLKINPDLNLYSGSQSFTETYYTHSQVERAIANPTILTPINLLFPGQSNQNIIKQTVTEEKQREVKRYQLLALSGSLPLTYTLNNWQFVFTPYLIKPFNQVNFVDNKNTNGNYFMFTAGASITF